MAALHHHRGSSRGFTLLELIVVLALLALVAALVAPNLKGLAQGRGSEEESRRLLSVLTHARDLARAKGDRVVFWVDADGRRYGLREGRDGQERFVYTVADRLRVQAFDAESQPIKEEADATFLPDGMIDDAPPTSFQLLENEQEYARLNFNDNTRRYTLAVTSDAP